MGKQYLGLAKLGQLKRIQHILFQQYRFNQEKVEDELAYILKGRGNYYPVWIDFDFSNNTQLKHQQNSIKLRQLKEMRLKKAVCEANYHNLSNPK